MSKQAKKRVTVKQKDIIDGCWYHRGVFQKQLSRQELDKINNLTKQKKRVTMRIVNQLKWRKK